jgi:branched-subunit amino acid transport protein
MSATWTTIAGLAVAGALIRGAGPVALGGRTLPPALTRMISVIAPALLAALVVTETFAGESQSLALDARAAGVAVAGAALMLRAPLILVVTLAAAAAAAARALGAA